jgi:hypothetical protein
MFADFIHFYNYTAEQALGEYAKRFFGLCSSMYRIKAKTNLMDLMVINHGTNGGDKAEGFIDELNKQAKGNHGILEEVRNIKNVN